MYTVLLVDDEKSILEGIERALPWEALGVDTVLSAQNGQEALELMHRHRPDVLITDIRMPVMDGLELARTVRTQYPATRCILLSAYGEFEYARAALTLGIENYLLKPLSVDELTASIQKSLDNLSRSRRIDRNLFHDNILLRWITGTISESELIERTPVLGVNLYSRNYCIVLIRRLHPGADMDGAASLYADVLSRACSLYMLEESEESRIIILAAHSIDAQALSAELSKAASASRGAEGTLLTVGSVVLGSTELSKSYYDAQSAARYAMLFSFEQVVVFGESPPLLMPARLQAQAQSLLDAPTLDAAMSGGQALLAELLAANAPPEVQRRMVGEAGALMLSRARETLPKNSLSQLDDALAARGAFLSASADGEWYDRWMRDLIGEIWPMYNSRSGGLSPIVQQAIRYIRDHYRTPISIKDFCSRFDMNASYLGYLFKNETGVFFNDYVSQIRISQALWMLENTNDKVASIAEQVGFSNVSYFIKCFKGQTGVSPVKYRQTKLAQVMQAAKGADAP